MIRGRGDILAKYPNKIKCTKKVLKILIFTTNNFYLFPSFIQGGGVNNFRVVSKVTRV